MNLYIFNETRRAAVFGVGTYIRELTAALKDSEVNICVVSLTSENPQIQAEELDRVKYWHFPSALAEQRTTNNQRQWELYYRNIVYLLRLRIEDTKDLIFHLNFCQSAKLAEELKSAFVCSVISVVHFTGWGFTINDNLPRLRNILKGDQQDKLSEKVIKSVKEEKELYEKSDRIICLSHFMKKILCSDYGLDVHKISVISNGLLDVTDVAIYRKNLRTKWNITPKEKIILFAGRLDEVKGVVFLIRAFREVLKKFQGCRLVIAGSGNYDLCFKEAKDVYSKIVFTGLLDKKDLNELYQIADIGVAPSLFEPFGYVAIEMMMHRLPVVATATSGLNELITTSCGLKIPLTLLPDRVEIEVALLSEKILYLLQNIAEVKKLGRNGRKRYLEKYSSNVFRRNMLKIYKSLCITGK